MRKPQKPHFDKAVLLTLTKPKFESKLKQRTLLEICDWKTAKKADVDNPYERIIAAEILENFKTSKQILFCHRNTFSKDDIAQVARLFKKSNMHMEIYGKKTMKMALEGTPYEGVLSFYISQNAIVFSPEINIKKSLQICKKYPNLIVLGKVSFDSISCVL